MTYGLELFGRALQPPPREENPSQGKTQGFDGGGGRYVDGSAECCGVVIGVESAMGDVEGGWVRWEWGILPWHRQWALGALLSAWGRGVARWPQEVGQCSAEPSALPAAQWGAVLQLA
jgi:hypothetical protein